MKKTFLVLLCVTLLTMSFNFASFANENTPEGYTVEDDGTIFAEGCEARDYIRHHNNFRVVQTGNDDVPAGYTVSEDGTIFAEGREARDYIVRVDGFRPYATTPPTATFHLSDHSQYSGSYSMTSYIYSNYCFYPHNTEGNIDLTIEPDTKQTIRIEVIPKGQTDAVWDKTKTISTGGLDIVIPKSYLDSSTAYYLKFTAIDNDGERITGNYYVT